MFDPYDHYEDFVDQKVTLRELASAHGVTRDQVRVSLRNLAKELGEFNLYINAIRRKMPPVWEEEDVVEEPGIPEIPEESSMDDMVEEWFKSGMSNLKFRKFHKLGSEFLDYSHRYCMANGVSWNPKNGSYCVTPKEKLERSRTLLALRRMGDTYSAIGRRYRMSADYVKKWIEDYERSQA